MTQEELDATIADLIIVQEKPKSTGNSHKRKQWENRRYWHLCTMGKTCKLGYVKICLIAKQKSSSGYMRSSVCWECVCCWHGFSSPWGIMGGVGYSCDSGTHYKKFSNKCPEFRRELNRLIRRRTKRTDKDDIGNYGYYRKIFDYEWGCV